MWRGLNGNVNAASAWDGRPWKTCSFMPRPRPKKTGCVNLGHRNLFFFLLFFSSPSQTRVRRGSVRPVILCLVESHYSFKWELIYLRGAINNVAVSRNYWGGSRPALAKRVAPRKVLCNMQMENAAVAFSAFQTPPKKENKIQNKRQIKCFDAARTWFSN